VVPPLLSELRSGELELPQLSVLIFPADLEGRRVLLLKGVGEFGSGPQVEYFLAVLKALRVLVVCEGVWHLAEVAEYALRDCQDSQSAIAEEAGEGGLAHGAVDQSFLGGSSDAAYDAHSK
jgi:hypothetical protein